MAKIVSATLLPTVTVEFTLDEALLVRAIFGRLDKETGLRLLQARSTGPYYPKALKAIKSPTVRCDIFDALNDYLGTQK